MTVGSQLAIDGLAQVEIADDSGGTQVKDLLHSSLQSLVGHLARAESLHQHADGASHADGVGQLHLAAGSQAGSHHILCHPAGSVSGAAIHLGGILAGESAAAVGCAAAVGVHDDLAAGQAGVALRAADNETTGGVDVVLGILVQQTCGNGGLNDQLDHILADLLQLHLGAVLGGDNHGVHAAGLAALIVLHGDLGLSIGTEIVHQTLLTHVGETLCHLVGQGDSQRHQLGGLLAGIAEHHALIACAVVQLSIAGLLGLKRLVHAQCNVAGLLVDVEDHAAGIAVETVLGAVIADVAHHLAGDLGDVHVAGGGDLTHNVDKTGGDGRLAGHAAMGVFFKDGVQHSVADLIADLIGMSLGNGLGSKQMLCHSSSPFLLCSAAAKGSAVFGGMQ